MADSIPSIPLLPAAGYRSGVSAPSQIAVAAQPSSHVSNEGGRTRDDDSEECIFVSENDKVQNVRDRKRLRLDPRAQPARPKASSGVRSGIRPAASVSSWEMDVLGMPARMVYYYVCLPSTRTGTQCVACHRRLLRSQSEACLGFKRPWLRDSTWIHATADCISAAAIPAVPRGRVLFSPSTSAIHRNIVFRALQLRMTEAALGDMARIMPWTYTPAIVQRWATNGLPCESEQARSLRLQHSARLHYGSDDEAPETSTAESAGLEQKLAQLVPARPLARHELRPDMSCAICHEDMAVGQSVRRLPCEHLFHDVCILPWLQRQQLCPLDRRRIDDVPPL
eukprot:TRINITY_DN20538_c0_g1_i1.p1 TRINITY_DN20538_c0_g1~~TRINITY_DN20538_c0_g1_i1.p1  ORF type:complete len:338 (+),score=13.52 TRINITY_DN20538_c0_g1_i1:25-1038(+)